MISWRERKIIWLGFGMDILQAPERSPLTNGSTQAYIWHTKPCQKSNCCDVLNHMPLIKQISGWEGSQSKRHEPVRLIRHQPAQAV
jgi:hypothetical protein